MSPEGSPRQALLEIDPLALEPEMRDFVDREVPRHRNPRVRLEHLQRAIFDPDSGLGVTYGSAATRTAAETFHAANGNCLSFTLLFGSLARYLDLEVYFVEVDEVTSWSQRSDIGVSHWHMYAEVQLQGQVVSVDFLPFTERRYRSSHRIGEARVQAHFHSNLGAETLADGDAEGALARFERALELDPGFHPAEINRAVALKRIGDSRAAEAILLQVLADEPGNAVAAANLAALYVDEGRQAEAQRWLQRRRRFLNRNPYHHFRLGMQALSDEQPQEARVHFKRAIARQPSEAIFFEQLAECHLQLGRPERARSNLRRALRVSEDPQRRQLIEARIERIAEGETDRS